MGVKLQWMCSVYGSLVSGFQHSKSLHLRDLSLEHAFRLLYQILSGPRSHVSHIASYIIYKSAIDEVQNT